MIDSTHLSPDLTALVKQAAPAVQRLAARADLNHDGTVTTSEFTEFLKQLTASINTDHQTTAPTTAAATMAAQRAAAVSSIRAIVATIAKER